jgi:SNF2 family DNA or RNA helicase
LAGRPLGRDPTLMWSQQYLIDRGESLGETLGMFRAGFFKERRGHFSMYEYTFDEDKRDLLGAFMQHRAITYASSECQKLPKVTRIKEEVKLPDDIAGYYEKAVQALIAAKGNYTQTKNIFLRMRQLSSGFLGMKDDETGERAQIVFPKNPKLDRLLDLIEEIPLDRKFVVFYEYTFSGRTIVKAIEEKLKIKCGWLWSGAKDRRTFQDRFDNDPKLRGAIVNNRLGSMVLNLQAANYGFAYEAAAGVIDYEQARKRIDREGQLLPVFWYDLIVRGTADQTILDNHAEGEELFQAVLRKHYGI